LRYKIIFTLFLCLVGVMVVLFFGIPVLKATSFDSKEPSKLKTKNKITNEDIILAGQQLIIPLLSGNENEKDAADNAGVSMAKPAPNWTVGQMSWPAVGWISSLFGLRDGCVHEGLDIAATEGEPVYAVRAGRVIFAGPRGTYGMTIIIDHGAGLTTLYAHASSLLVQENDWVQQGQLIARVGSTGHSNGPHLHFEVRLNEVPYDPLHFLAHISA